MEGQAITLIFAGGESFQIIARPLETIEQAARRQGIRLLSDCREGACGTCKARCLRGEYLLNDYSREALPESEAADGYVLTCQMCARSPCVVEFDYPLLETSVKPPEPFTALLQSVHRVSESVVRLVLQVASGDRLNFLPGQYVNIAVPNSTATRAYSFGNEPNSDELIFYVRLIEGGAMGEYLLRRARPGERLRLQGPVGRFFLRDAARPVLMIAGGTGLAPMLSILRHLATSGETPPRILLVYGANRPSDLFGLDELAELKAKVDCLETVVCVATGESGWTGPIGFVSDVAAAQDMDFGAVDVYLCGPPPMIEHAQTLLMARGARRERLFAERFLPT